MGRKESNQTNNIVTLLRFWKLNIAHTHTLTWNKFGNTLNNSLSKAFTNILLHVLQSMQNNFLYTLQ